MVHVGHFTPNRRQATNTHTTYYSLYAFFSDLVDSAVRLLPACTATTAVILQLRIPSVWAAFRYVPEAGCVRMYRYTSWEARDPQIDFVATAGLGLYPEN